MATLKCEICGKTLSAADNHYYDEGGYYVCDECWESEFVDCECCGTHIRKDEAYQVGEESGVFVCEECYENECTRCDRCGDIIFYDDANHTHYGDLCDCCYGDLFG